MPDILHRSANGRNTSNSRRPYLPNHRFARSFFQVVRWIESFKRNISSLPKCADLAEEFTRKTFPSTWGTPCRAVKVLPLRVGSSSTSSKLWILSSDTRDSQFDLTRAHASMGRRKLTCAMINEQPDRPIVTSCAALSFLQNVALCIYATPNREVVHVTWSFIIRSEFLVPADSDDRSRCHFTLVNLCIPILVQIQQQIISLCVLARWYLLLVF